MVQYEDADEDERKRGSAETDEELLVEIRERFTYASNCFHDIQEESKVDRRYIAGNPWEESDRKARADAGRPCINHDELNQYVNQAINNLRQNKRGIKIDPDAFGADEKTAELKQDLVRTIEYRSNATSAYVTAYQAALEGSYGFFRIGRRYVECDELTAENFDHQEIVVRNIANPDSVLFDPDCKEADWGDARFCFVLNPIPRDEFKRSYPKARITDFTSEQIKLATDWFSDQMVLTAEYWRVETSEKTKYLLASGEVVDKLPAGETAESERTETKRRIVQYITNGVEILKRTPEPGKILPIIPVIGKEMYLGDGGGSKRTISSLVRLARDPQMTLAYLCSQELEEAGLTPKVPYKGYVGQFETDKEAWDNITKQPRPYVQADLTVDQSSGQTLPLPVREQFTPNFQVYEIAKDSARRAIQAAMGINSLPTAAQRDNQKSGVAIEKIQTAQNIGSFHFLDNFDRALMLAGRAIDERIPVVYGQPNREMMLRRADESHRHVKLNTDEPYFDDKMKANVHYPVDKGTHTVTISSGPSYDSQREAVGQFVDTLIENLKGLPIPPPAAAKILSIAIQMKELGPKGDQLAEIISPPDPNGATPEMQQMMAHVQQQQQQAALIVQELQAELQKLQQEKAGKVVDNEYKLKLEQMKIEADIAKAEVTTKYQELSERVAWIQDAWSQLHGQAHDAGLQAQDQAHERDQAAAAAQQQQQLAQQQQAADQQAEPQAA